MPHSPSTGPLILLYHFQSQAVTSGCHTGTAVTCSWQHSKSSQRNVIAASPGRGKLTACRLGIRRLSIPPGSWQRDLWQRDIPWHDPLPAVSTLSSCSFKVASWSGSPHLCFTFSLLISSCIASFYSHCYFLSVTQSKFTLFQASICTHPTGFAICDICLSEHNSPAKLDLLSADKVVNPVRLVLWLRNIIQACTFSAITVCLVRWYACQINIHMHARTQSFPPELCILMRW